MSQKRFRVGRQLSGPELRAFRSDLSKLKRAGLLPKNVAVKSARPFTVRGGQPLYQYLHDYRDVLTGNAAAVELPRGAVVEQHKLGRKSVHGRVLIPKAPGERVTVSKSGTVKITETESGVSRIDIPAKFLDKRFEKRVAEQLKGIKGEKYFGYKFYGHKHYKYYTDLSQLIADLKRRYQPKISERDISSGQFYDHISIITSAKWKKLVKEEGPAYGAPKKKAAKKPKKPAPKKRSKKK